MRVRCCLESQPQKSDISRPDPGNSPGEQHGLIAATEDQIGSAGIQWYNGSYEVTNAIDTSQGKGETNTNKL